MPTATLTSKGQITMPIAVRTALGLHAGAKVDFVETDGGFKIVPLQTTRASLKGRFAGRVVKAVTLAEMDAGIAQTAVRRNARAGK